jgi:hypothetical protein
MLRQIGAATIMYANENRGQLPPMARDLGDPTYNCNASSTPSSTAEATVFQRSVNWPYFTNQGSVAEVTNPQIGAGIGRLVITKHLKGKFEQMVQDPAGYTGDRNYLNNYCYNVHPAAFGSGSPPSITSWAPWWKTLPKYGKAPKGPVPAIHGYSWAYDPAYEFGVRFFALASCPLLSQSTGKSIGYAPHMVKSNYAINLLGADGSVRQAVVPSTVVRENVINWNRFLDVLTYAEMSVGGQGTGSKFWVSSGNPYNYIPVNPRIP